ncbi:hypothetical protein [Gemmatimonas sp.]|uniref:hypothetical protein n=1 Tax=Gemmatimonas sp. TaxID=1962908 RepID=UPI00286DB2EC|nr:hypothetical protein [Gemmatimonas sp.]
MFRETWMYEEDSPGNPVPLDGGAREWFFRWVHERPSVREMDGDIRDRVVDLIVDRIAEAVRWIPSASYKGEGHTHGEWKVEPEQFDVALARCRQQALRERAAQADAPHHRSLDAWLHAERNGLLAARGSCGGSAQLSRDVRLALARTANARSRSWPRECRDCGHEFRPTIRHTVRCDTCRAGLRSRTRPTRRTERPADLVEHGADAVLPSVLALAGRQRRGEWIALWPSLTAEERDHVSRVVRLKRRRQLEQVLHSFVMARKITETLAAIHANLGTPRT